MCLIYYRNERNTNDSFLFPARGEGGGVVLVEGYRDIDNYEMAIIFFGQLSFQLKLETLL